MPWPEIETAKKENRHELALSGKEISDRIDKNGLDPQLFTLTGLNYLDIHKTTLSTLPPEISKLSNLQTLVLHSNMLEQVPPAVGMLEKLKMLDVSQNLLKALPEEIVQLRQLTTLNVSGNLIQVLPAFSDNPKLAVVDASNNKLNEFPNVCHAANLSLSEIRVSGNEIESIPSEIGALLTLKLLQVNSNKIKIVPGELTDCTKLKELNLKDNPISDKRLLKLIDQCHLKQVLDYVRQRCQRSTTNSTKSTAKKKGGAKQSKTEDGIGMEAKEEVGDFKYKISVRHADEDGIKIVVKEDVKNIRPHIIACIITDIAFTPEVLKKFIQLQTKLHDTVCEKRNAATIATHDLNRIVEGNLTYTSVEPTKLIIQPLHSSTNVTGAELFAKLQAEADALRKEKKRNVYSGIHKYLYLVEGKPKYACLLDSKMQVISFPPITNANITKIGLETKSMLLEVTSATSQFVCKKVASALLKEMLPLFSDKLTICQVKNVDTDGNLKAVFPARNDLLFEDTCGICVERE